jgi:hypothetical protein
MDTPATAGPDVADIIEIRDPQIDVDALMARIRENVARRRREGAYTEDLDVIAEEVFAGAMAGQVTSFIAGGDVHNLAASMAELNARWMVREVPFASNVPVFGPLIVVVRNAWNWMSTKWYVRPILHQLVGFNALVVRALNDSVAIQQGLTEEVRQLRAEAAALRKEIERLQASDTAAGD